MIPPGLCGVSRPQLPAPFTLPSSFLLTGPLSLSLLWSSCGPLSCKLCLFNSLKAQRSPALLPSPFSIDNPYLWTPVVCSILFWHVYYSTMLFMFLTLSYMYIWIVSSWGLRTYFKPALSNRNTTWAINASLICNYKFSNSHIKNKQMKLILIIHFM